MSKKGIPLLLFLFTFVSFIIGFLFNSFLINKLKSNVPYINSVLTKEKPLKIYTIDNLSKISIKTGSFSLIKTLKTEKEFNSFLFSFSFNPNLDNKTIKKTTGLINMPSGPGPKNTDKYPLIVMIRGFVNQQTYTTGQGSLRAGEYYAKNGYITIAPDFLGYADSDSEAGNIFESRFQTYTTVLSLLSSINDQTFTKLTNEKWDGKNIFIWGHSNGGQIALTTLEITGKNYPTALWAPVSKPFPYSILYFTDESDDKGKFIRKELAKFEEDYNADEYSLDNYLDRIKAPIQLSQGTADDSVPETWSILLSKELKSAGVKLDYLTYPGADHNLNPSWNIVVEKNLEFYHSMLQ